MCEEMSGEYINVSQTTSDLRAKVIDFGNEKSSLITAVKLVQQDTELSNRSTRANFAEYLA
jgi:hypothetical protein